MQTIPFDAYLGVSKSGQAIGCTIYQLDGTTVCSAFSVAGWYESPAGSGAYHHAGLSLPDAGGVVAVGISGTEYQRLAIGADVAATVWAYATRTLTITAAPAPTSTQGATLYPIKAATFAATLPGLSISASWSKVYFTVKSSNQHGDDQAIVQIVKSNPAAGNDGLLRLNRAATTAAQGSLTVDQPSGAVTITIADDATALLNANDYQYDLKVLLSDGSSTVLAQGACQVRLTATHTV